MRPPAPADVHACRYLPGVPRNFRRAASTPGLRETQTLAAAQLRDSFAALVIGLALSGLSLRFAAMGELLA